MLGEERVRVPRVCWRVLYLDLSSQLTDIGLR